MAKPILSGWKTECAVPYYTSYTEDHFDLAT
jgi:hypothetical protein